MSSPFATRGPRAGVAARRGLAAMAAVVALAAGRALATEDDPRAFVAAHCVSCHDADQPEGGLNLAALRLELSHPENFARWVKIFDRVRLGEMPPKQADQPAPESKAAFTRSLRAALLAAEQARFAASGRTRLRRLTRAEYENTLRDLFDLPGLALRLELPEDGSAHGFDKNADALDISHVNMARYVEAADKALDFAIATRPRPPAVTRTRTTLAYPAGFVAHVLMHGDGVLLKDKRPDPDFPPAGAHAHLDQGAHERMGSFRNGASVGLFRHEDESFHPYFNEFVAVHPGRYRVRLSLWSFQWDRGAVLPSRGTEAARLSVVTLTGDGRGGGHPSTVLAYFDASSLTEQTHELEVWFNPRDTLGFNAASLAPGAPTRGKNRAMGFTGPGIACDWLEIEGPLHDVWPPVSHRRLFGDLPLVEFPADGPPGATPPPRTSITQPYFPGRNRPDPVAGVWTVRGDAPLADADRLLADFLPRAFRRAVPDATRRRYLALVERRLAAGDCFETALRGAYRAALCSPDFLHHVEPAGELDGHALACRLSYLLWNSCPDERLARLGASGALRDPATTRAEVERLLADPKSNRFVDDFLGQWLSLRKITATDPDPKLYPEYSAYLKDSMVAETRAYFREMLDRDLDAEHLARSSFVMVNQKLAAHYGIPGVVGSATRRVELPPDCPRGGLLTQAAILKITANGATTSPVTRGAFVMDRLLGQPPEPPPANVAAIEPDVRGATTIREQLAKHRDNPACASCHAQFDPPGFALESFDVIGGFRQRYRSIGQGDPAPRGTIDPFIGVNFKLGPPVDCAGELADGRKFASIRELQAHLAADKSRLLANLAERLLVYAAGRPVSFGDRDALADIVARTEQQGGGVRALLREITLSPLFRTR